MERFQQAIQTFEHAIDRACQMIDLFDALTKIRPGNEANDDALRAAYFQAVSSFDFFAHEIAVIEAKHRFQSGVKTRNISLPMEVMTLPTHEDRVEASATQIRAINSYRAFVDPGKLAEMLSCYCEAPWTKICARFNQGLSADDRKSEADLKGQLKSIWKRRNQIAHEADVDPTLAGVSLWPIYKDDTEITINFMREIASHLPHVISQEF